MKALLINGSDDLYADVQHTMRLVAEMNTGYHTEAEVRDFLREITRSDVPDNMVVAGRQARDKLANAVQAIKDAILQSQRRALGAVNQEQLALYYGIGSTSPPTPE